MAHRFRFFVDADVDRLLGRVVPANIVLTDGRDLESYGLCHECVEHICRTGFPASGLTGAALMELVRRVARPIGVLRVASQRAGWNLPFQRTLRSGIQRFLATTGGTQQVDLHRLITNLIQNSDHGLSLRDDVINGYDTEVRLLEALPDNQIVHGKDFIDALAWRFDVTAEEIERLLFMSIAVELGQVRQLAGIRSTEEWLGGSRSGPP